MIDNEKNFYTRKYVLLQRDTGRKPKKKKDNSAKWMESGSRIMILYLF